MKVTRMSERGLPPLNIMLYGKPGCGKTAAAATAAMKEGDEFGMYDVVVANVEGGMLTMHDMPLTNDPTLVDIDTPNDLEELTHMVMNGKAPFKTVGTVIADSLTEIVAKDLESTTMRNLPKATRSGKRRQNVDDIWLEDRGEVSARMARVARGLRDIDIQFVATAHPREVYPNDENGMPNLNAPPIKVEPGFGPRLCQHLCGYFDFVWYLQRHPSGEFVRVVTQPWRGIFAKTRGEEHAKTFGTYFDWPVGRPLLPDVRRAMITREWDYTTERSNTIE